MQPKINKQRFDLFCRKKKSNLPGTFSQNLLAHPNFLKSLKFPNPSKKKKSKK